MNKMVVLLPSLVLLLQGCANFNSIHRDLDVDSGRGALIDIKQRAIIVSKRTTTDADGKTTVQTRVCSEPSPDALSAFANSLTGDISIPDKVAAKLGLTSQEGAAFTGLRTQSIELLKQSLLAICEGYLSGAIDEPNYNILMRRYQKYTVALLAIEQLTGTVRVPPITINTQGSAEAAASLADLEAKSNALDAAIKDLQAKQPPAGASDDEKAAFNKQTADAIKAKQADKDAITKGIENARGIFAGGSTNSTVQSVQTQALGSGAVQAVTEAVKDIVKDIVDTDDEGQLCVAYLANKPSVDGVFTEICKQFLKNRNDLQAVRVKYVDSLVKERIRLIVEQANAAAAVRPPKAPKRPAKKPNPAEPAQPDDPAGQEQHGANQLDNTIQQVLRDAEHSIASVKMSPRELKGAVAENAPNKPQPQ